MQRIHRECTWKYNETTHLDYRFLFSQNSKYTLAFWVFFDLAHIFLSNKHSFSIYVVQGRIQFSSKGQTQMNLLASQEYAYLDKKNGPLQSIPITQIIHMPKS